MKFFHCFIFILPTLLIFGLIDKTISQILDNGEVLGVPDGGLEFNPHSYPHITRNSFYNHLVPSLALGSAAFLFGAQVGPKYFEYFKKAKAKKYGPVVIHGGHGWSPSASVPVEYKYHEHKHDHDHYHHPTYSPYYNYYKSGWGSGGSEYYSPSYNPYYYSY